jgi:3-isopropylmalate/(R)-2-methylmalate dehydratase small subunit
MRALNIISGTAAPLPLANIDTDQIIPKQFLKRVERSGFGEFLFFDWASDHEGELDPGFVLNKPEYQESVILVTGKNFGSGSSREHAPWALEDWGFEAIVAESFADIFKGNCSKMGLLTVELTEAEIASLVLIAETPGNTVSIDLPAQKVTSDGFEASFEIDQVVKHNLINGLDHIELSLHHVEHIETFEQQRPNHHPVVTHG